MGKYKEILRLKKMLSKSVIPHEMRKVHGGWQIGYPVLPPDTRNVCSVIEHTFSYGNREDLLEIMGLTRNDDYVEGYLSAEDVYERILFDYKKRIYISEDLEILAHFHSCDMKL